MENSRYDRFTAGKGIHEPVLVYWLPWVLTCDLRPDHFFLSQSSYGPR